MGFLFVEASMSVRCVLLSAVTLALAPITILAATPAADSTKSMVAATIGDRTITIEEVDRAAASKLAKVRSDEYEARRTTLDNLIAQQLVEAAAKQANQPVDQWLTAQVEAKVVPPTDAEVAAAYEQNKARLGTQTLEQAKPALVDSLKQQQRARLRQELVAGLRTKAGVKVNLQPPRADVDEAGNPVRGPREAPVSIVTFSDYQCPFCSRAEATINQVREVYGDKVRVVFRDYPLSFHQYAQKAAEAAGCAGEQGKFWELHDKLFANQQKLTVDDLKKYAAETPGIDAAKFNECLDSGRRADEVKKDFADGAALGVTGTPAFFVNGRFISGAQPFANFEKVIDEELTFKGVAIPAKPAVTAAAAPPNQKPPAPTPAPAPAKAK